MQFPHVPEHQRKPRRDHRQRRACREPAAGFLRIGQPAVHHGVSPGVGVAQQLLEHPAAFRPVFGQPVADRQLLGALDRRRHHLIEEIAVPAVRFGAAGFDREVEGLHPARRGEFPYFGIAEPVQVTRVHKAAETGLHQNAGPEPLRFGAGQVGHVLPRGVTDRRLLHPGEDSHHDAVDFGAAGLAVRPQRNRCDADGFR